MSLTVNKKFHLYERLIIKFTFKLITSYLDFWFDGCLAKDDMVFDSFDLLLVKDKWSLKNA